MRSAFEHLDFEHKNNLSLLIQKITTAVAIEKIVCYGFSIKSNHRHNCSGLGNTNTGNAPAIFYLLVIPDKEEPRCSHDIIQTIDNFNTPLLSVSCIILREPFVSTAISEGRLFLTTLRKKGCLLYGYEWKTTPLSAKEEPLQHRLAAAELIWKQVFTRAQQFLQGAAFCLKSQMPETCCFLLHQAVEQTTMALSGALIGYRPDSHNLLRLLPLLAYAGLELDTVFPQNTQQEKDLFNILKKSYSETRYNNDFSIPQNTAQILYNRTANLMTQAETIFLFETNKWRGQQPIHNKPALNVAFLNTLNNAS
ncbi:HEPN domain-containing protein [Filimonas effusa]|uniref:HEPN domain-containing protein n=1 Tax=Filimonas effusa TaxID=2508721 RepID=A0A4V1MA33_9BACT|nr:HEPN domain-containing protein [Filimonas effusa]RXK83774.1 HEPN domain-containing protein [Filimonas effusa]